MITPADLAARLNATPAPKEPVYGMCLACRAIEVELFDVIGTRDLSHIGEHPRYPVGYGCEVCA